jgi:NAD(P)-dependent dehydrogenase (short-subunit alcohol dehydrogenase family)
VGPGLGLALARRFARSGYKVAMLARQADRLEAFARTDSDYLVPIACDLTSASAVSAAFDAAENSVGPLSCAIFNAGAFRPGSILDIPPEDFEHCWRVGAFAGFLVGQQAARRMVERTAGTILFTGATASLRGAARFANLASPKFALRGLAQSMARELGPKGVHVAHIIIDGQIYAERYEHLLAERGSDSLLQPDAIADVYFNLHEQPRSAWAHEMDLRPWSEKF